MKLARCLFLWGAAGIALGGCSSPAQEQPVAPPPAANKVDIQVDANRDGFVNDADDAVSKTAWDKTQGAAFLANLDDDDHDGKRDADDEIVNGPDDAYELGRIVLKPLPDAPEGVTGALALAPAAAGHVRIFLQQADGSWQLVIGGAICDKPGKAPGNGQVVASGQLSLSANDEISTACPTKASLTEAQVRGGVELGIEGRTLVGLLEAGKWDGFVDLTYTVSLNGAPISTPASPTGSDEAKMRVAPWMMFGNLTPKLDTVFAGSDYGPEDSDPFLAGLTPAVKDAGLGFHPISANAWNDQWTEDYFQTGMESVPWAPDANGDPQVNGIRLAMPRPFGQGGATDKQTESLLPVHFLQQNHLGPGLGYFVVYHCQDSLTGCGQTYDSHGNHDLLPPYRANGESFPYGRIIHGSGILAETHAFYDAQLVQAPVIQVKTDWLNVGHVDEVFSYVAAGTPRGWKLLVASPRRARQMLTDWQKQGFGQQKLFAGKMWLDNNNGPIPAEITIDAVLADMDLMNASQSAQLNIDAMVAQMKMEVGLADDEIVEMPTLFENVDEGDGPHALAYSPGTVNLRSFGGTYAVVADPFGPQINGTDGLKQDLMDRLATDKNQLGADGKGLRLYFTDDWNLYHRLEGEVHCGSNQEGPPQPKWTWWERIQ